jgi:D-alanyl-D-alanine carboxypeptidase
MKSFLAILLFAGFIQNSANKDYLLGRFDPSTDSRFVQLTAAQAKGNAVNRFLRKEAFEAFQKMASSARKDGVDLFIVSATRTFDYQKKIWEDKWNGKIKVEGKNLTSITNLVDRAQLILKYSAMPGTSRHHWGTDIDLNSTEDDYFLTDEGIKVYQWLATHATEFGFCQPYTSKVNGRTGYEEEKWHWSYLPLSKIYLTDYQKLIQYNDIAGFEGSETAGQLQIISSYVSGIACE